MELSILNNLKLPDATPEPLHKAMRKDTNPIFIWGCGNLAENVYHYCQQFDVKIAGCFVDVPVSETSFHNMIVTDMDSLLKKHDQFSVVIGYANYPAGVQKLKTIKNISSVYCITSCCRDKWGEIPENYFERNSLLLDSIYHNLADDISQKCLEAFFRCKLNDRSEFMYPLYKQGNNYYRNDIIEFTGKEVLIDIGAFEGDSIWPFVDATNGMYKQIVAVEPDDSNAEKLEKNISERGLPNTVVKKVCIYNEDGYVKFAGNGQTGNISATATDYRMYPAMKLDTLFEEMGIESSHAILKINIYVSVPEMLQGAENILKNDKPTLIIRVGFDENVLLDVYREIERINPSYKIYLRYTLGIPHGLTLFAI